MSHIGDGYITGSQLRWRDTNGWVKTIAPGYGVMNTGYMSWVLGTDNLWHGSTSTLVVTSGNGMWAPAGALGGMTYNTNPLELDTSAQLEVCSTFSVFLNGGTLNVDTRVAFSVEAPGETLIGTGTTVLTGEQRIGIDPTALPLTNGTQMVTMRRIVPASATGNYRLIARAIAPPTSLATLSAFPLQMSIRPFA